MSQGAFVWAELMTTDTKAAAAFYGAVIGWTAAESDLAGLIYTTLSAGDVPVAGLLELPPQYLEAGGNPVWTSYIAVEDVDAMAARIALAGGAIQRPAWDIPGVGRAAVVADPQGAVFNLFRGMGDMPPPGGFTPGRVGWHELHAGAWDSAFAFYAGLFGWTKGAPIDMGPMGIYQLFEAGGVAVGGMMTKMDQAAPASWLDYFNVEDIGAAAARVKTAGGEVAAGPMPVPGGSWILHGLDPQGARFALVAPGAA